MTAALRIDGLVKDFGGLRATDHLSFEVAEGEALGIIGPNGAGKTTVFSQIMGELRQTAGAISLFGEEISARSTAERIRRGVSRTYQVPRPFADMSVAENIRVGLTPNSLWRMIFEGPDPEEEREIALKVGFSAADLERRPAELAMGDLRKLELARTMATKPKVMLLDEVFAGLSAGEIDQVSAVVQEMRRAGMTFLIVSHDLPALEPMIDRAIAIERGRMIAEGDFDSVVADPAVRASYLGDAHGAA